MCVGVCVCAWVRAHIMCISECGGAGTGGGTFAIISMNVHAFKYILCLVGANVSVNISRFSPANGDHKCAIVC